LDVRELLAANHRDIALEQLYIVGGKGLAGGNEIPCQFGMRQAAFSPLCEALSTINTEQFSHLKHCLWTMTLVVMTGKIVITFFLLTSTVAA
jgi:hypothetical protein